MPAQIDLKTEGLSEKLQAVMNLPNLFARARRSALSSVGANAMVEMRNHIEYGGSGWPPLHPITLRLRKFQAPAKAPMFYLGRFSRYLVNKDGTMLEIGFGKSGKGKPGQIDDPWLTAAAARAEFGQFVRVSKKTRLVWLTVKGRRDPRSGAAVGSFFALRPGTNTLTIPKRPIFGPVYRKIAPKVAPHFEAVFWASYERYESGAAKSTEDMDNMGWRS